MCSLEMQSKSRSACVLSPKREQMHGSDVTVDFKSFGIHVTSNDKWHKNVKLWMGCIVLVVLIVT